MKIEEIARLCHEVNKAYCKSVGDNSQHSWNDAPDWQKDSAIKGVQFHMANDTTPEQTHESWLAQKILDGWTYGETKDPENKTHPCMVAYELLPESQKSKDYIFKAICDFFKEMYQ